LAGIQILSCSVLFLVFCACSSMCSIMCDNNKWKRLSLVLKHCNTMKYSSVFNNDYNRYSLIKTKAQQP
jgi:hypothetical protein